MKNKILAAIILLTPIAVVVASSIIFSAGISPTNTNNNGVFFKDYFNFEQFSIKEDKEEFKFTESCIFSVALASPDSRASFNALASSIVLPSTEPSALTGNARTNCPDESTINLSLLTLKAPFLVKETLLSFIF